MYYAVAEIKEQALQKMNVIAHKLILDYSPITRLGRPSRKIYTTREASKTEKKGRSCSEKEIGGKRHTEVSELTNFLCRSGERKDALSFRHINYAVEQTKAPLIMSRPGETSCRRDTRRLSLIFFINSLL